MNRKIKGIGVATLLVGALAGCRASTDSNQVAVHVTGANIIPTAKKPVDCVAPSTNKYIGVGDSAYVYPAGQRTFAFDSKDGSDFPPISVTSKDNVTLNYSGAITFYLNTDCNTLLKFHTTIGSKKWNGHPAYVNDNDKGWVSMLDVDLGKPLQNALSDVANHYNYLAQYTGASRAGIEAAVASTLEERVKGFTGGDYFTRIAVTLNKPGAPDSIVKALEDKQAAVQENSAQAARNLTALTSTDQVTECVKKRLSEAVCFQLYAINSGKVPYVVSGNGPALSLNK